MSSPLVQFIYKIMLTRKRHEYIAKKLTASAALGVCFWNVYCTNHFTTTGLSQNKWLLIVGSCHSMFVISHTTPELLTASILLNC